MIDAYTKKDLAQIAGYTYRRLHDIDMSLPESKKLFIKSEDGKYDLALFVQRWVEYQKGAAEEAEEQSLDEVRAAHEAVKMQKTELEVAKMRGQLVEVDEVRRLWGGVAHSVMQNCMRLPSKIAPQVMGVQNIEVISGIVEKEIRAVLNAIADTPLPTEAHEQDEEEADEGE